MKLLRDILYKVAIQEVHGTNELEVQGVTFDSRTVNSGFL